MYEQQRIRVKENGYVTFLLVCGITILCIRSYDMVNRVWEKKKIVRNYKKYTNIICSIIILYILLSNIFLIVLI